MLDCPKKGVFHILALSPGGSPMDQNISNYASPNACAELCSESAAQLSHREIASTLHAQGEKALLDGDLQCGLEHFEQAIKLDPANYKLLYQQGLALFDFGCEEGREKTMRLASRKFKLAAALQPDDFNVWQAWGSVLTSLGWTYSEHHYFLEAKEKLVRAIALSDQQGRDTLSELQWDLGTVLAELAEHSGEAADMHQAIEAFQKANVYEEKLPANFWHDYGSACLAFAGQINDLSFYAKAISCFKEAAAQDGSAHENWLSLGKALQQLYQLTHEEDHFSQANDCLATAAQLQPQDEDLWLDWARFLCDSAKRVADVKRLQMCIEKCSKAHVLNLENAMTQAVWAEALALLGSYTERLDLIHEAQNKISDASDEDSDSPEIWYSYGICLQALGQYFNDFDYYYQAIEKFQQGLSIDRTCHKHWHAIGWTYSLLGDLEGDPEALELSLRFFRKAIDLSPSTYYLFDYSVALAKLGEITRQQSWLEESVSQFERVLHLQKNAIYLHPDWLFHYACTLDALGDFFEEESYYLRAVEIFSHVLMVDPDFAHIHHHIAIALNHLGELTDEIEYFYRCAHHFRLAAKNDEENDVIVLDWATALVNIAQLVHDSSERDQLFRDAEHKLLLAMRLGNVHSYYHLACVHSLTGLYEKAMRFLLKAWQNEALPSMDEILQDDWLEDLRQTSYFQEFITAIEHRRNYQEEC